jgi:hypothetical protein
MPDEKLRILVIGGDKRNLTDHVLEWTDPYHVEQYDKKIPTNAAEGAKAVVVITRWISHSMFDAGRKFAKARGIPMVQATTGNYIIAGLVKSGLLPREAESKLKRKEDLIPDPSKEEQASVPASGQAPKKETEAKVEAELASENQTTGLPPEQLWLLYGSKAVHVIKAALKPGDKVHEDDLLELMSMPDGVGVPKADAVHLLSELQAIGAVVNVKGKTWKVPNLDVDYDYKTGEEDASEEPGPKEDDQEEALPVLALEKKPKVTRSKDGRAESKIIWIELLGGIHPGPYRSQQALWDEALEHVEFSKKDGQPLSREYYWQLIPDAIGYGVVERLSDGSYAVQPDEKIKLTRRDGRQTGGGRKTDKNGPSESGGGQPDTKKEAEGDLKTGHGSMPPSSTVPKQENKPAKKPGPKPGDPVKQVKAHYGGSIPTLDRYTVPTRTLKRMVPENDWSELASRQIGKITGVQNWRDLAFLKTSFDASEWDRLACDMLRTLPIEVIMPFLKEVPQDYELHCVECGSKFMFTVSEQEFTKRMVSEGKFETFEIPKRCASCRSKARAEKAKVRL